MGKAISASHFCQLSQCWLLIGQNLTHDTVPWTQHQEPLNFVILLPSDFIFIATSLPWTHCRIFASLLESGVNLITHLFFNSLFKSDTQLVLSTSVITFTFFFKIPIAPLNFSFVISQFIFFLIQQMKNYILPLCPQRELYVQHCISHLSHVVCLIYMWKLNVCFFEQNSVLDPNNYKDGSAAGKRQTSMAFAFEEHTHMMQPAGDKTSGLNIRIQKKSTEMQRRFRRIS